MTTRHARISSDLGELTLVADRHSLVGVYFPHHWNRPAEGTFGPLVDAAGDALLGEAAAQLRDYLAGHRTSFDLPTALAGDTFRQRVWAMLADIRYGEMVTYGDLAVRLGDKALAQRVGQAVGRNPLSIVVPCHRVVGAGGKLTGYAGGIKRKRSLLELERASVRLF
jgi:methylated-DNA-[protein]-cysteine S-methyltransferase